MDGQNLDRLGIGVEAPAAVFRVGRLGVESFDPPGQPGPERRRAELGCGSLLVQQLGHVPEIGEIALAGDLNENSSGKPLGDQDGSG